MWFDFIDHFIFGENEIEYMLGGMGFLSKLIYISIIESMANLYFLKAEDMLGGMGFLSKLFSFQS